MNDLIRDNFLQHHGVLGQKWGVRRFQPYGQGGYNPENKGKFVGKKIAKQNYKSLKDAYAKGEGHKHNIVESFRESDNFKKFEKKVLKSNKALRRQMNWEEKADKELRKLSSYKKRGLDKSDFNQAVFDEHMRKATKAGEEYDKLWEEGDRALEKEARQYAKDILGNYGNKKIKKLRKYDNKTINEKLEDLLVKDLTWVYDPND